MTPYQLDESANAPCTRTMVGLPGCAVAAAPVSKRPTNTQTVAKIFILSFLFLHLPRNRIHDISVLPPAVCAAPHRHSPRWHAPALPHGVSVVCGIRARGRAPFF